jgi:hypothetical protein
MKALRLTFLTVSSLDVCLSLFVIRASFHDLLFPVGPWMVFSL